jgi:Asp-tRNA(Asn)/Glu-tRNA(Gln) amidotransferase A subunit family amidase
MYLAAPWYVFFSPRSDFSALSNCLQNPHKLSLTAGGSSGGEGALVGMRGSILGVGTDIAGSIRIPALCCGTFGFKPSTDRIPMGGQVIPVKDGNLPSQ